VAVAIKSAAAPWGKRKKGERKRKYM